MTSSYSKWLGLRVAALALAAFALARLATFIPITPGGMGTTDAALVALLTSFGATNNQALAATLVWRAGTYVPQATLGVITLVWWRFTKKRREAANGRSRATQGRT